MTQKQPPPRVVTNHSISLVEVIIALVILSATIGGLVLSGADRNKKSQFTHSRDRIQHLCHQAYRFSAMNIHVTTVVLHKNDDNQWEAYLSLWGDSDTMLRVTQNCKQLKDLKWVQNVLVDGQSVSELELQFFGHEGLSGVYAKNAWGSHLPEFDLIHAPGRTKPQIPQITFEAPFSEIDPLTKRNTKAKRALDLERFAIAATDYPPFPNEYTHEE